MLTEKVSGEALRKAREAHGMTGPELATLLGLEASTVYRYERHERQPSARVFKRMCEVLGLTRDDLLAGSKEVA